jgi:hypothetical protein
MKKISHLFITTLAGALLLAGGACSSKPGTSPSGTGGTSGLGGSSGVAGDPLVSSATGFVDDTAVTGVVGAWYVYADSAGPNANMTSTDFADSGCNKGGFTATQCSMTMPTAGQTFPPTTMATSQMCTSGTASKVIMANGANDYSDLWGAGIGLDFNNPGGDAGVKGDFDMTPYTGVAFDFSGTTIPTNSMRVNFPFDGENGGTDSPYWEGGTMAYSPLAVQAPPAVQHVVIHWADVGGPMYLVQQNITPPKFDITKVQSIQFQVFTNTTSTSPYQFCVANLALLTD